MGDLDPRDGDRLVTIGALTVPVRLLDGPGQSIDSLIAALPIDYADVAAMLFTLPRGGWRPIASRTATIDDMTVVLAAPHDHSGWVFLRLTGHNGAYELTADQGPYMPEPIV